MSVSGEQLLELVEERADLGHAARNRSFLRQLKMVLGSVGTSFPQAAGKKSKSSGKGSLAMADLASLYRFAKNDRVELDELRRIRARTVLDAHPQVSEMAVIHDLSPLDFSKQNAKSDRRPIGDGRGRGYEYVSCAAVDPQTSELLGILHDTVINAEGPDDVGMMDYDYEPLFEDFSEEEREELRANHRHQMAVHVHGLSSLLEDRRVIHVADREFDDIFVMDRCIENGEDFVIRAVANRNVQVPHGDWIPQEALTGKQFGHPLEPGWDCVHLTRLVQAVPLQPYKDLPLDKKGRVTDKRRAARIAHLSIGACPVRLYRQARRNYRYFKPHRPLQLNMVVIRETDPPPGVEPLCWVLFTTLPVDTAEQLAYVGRLYELRWKIEEYFRLLKTGHLIEKQRFFDAKKTARVLILLSLASMTIFHLKRELGLPVGGYLDDDSYQKLKQATRETDNPDIDLKWRLLAYIAKSGGWLGRRNDPLGPTLLMRGWLQVSAELDAAARQTPLLQQVLHQPDLLRSLIRV